MAGPSGRCTAGVGAALIGSAGSLGDGPAVRSLCSKNFENIFMQSTPHLSSFRDHQTLPEIFPDLVGTCCLHHCSHLAPESILRTQHTDRRMYSSLGFEQLAEICVEGLWIQILPLHPILLLSLSLALTLFTWPLPRDHILMEEEELNKM